MSVQSFLSTVHLNGGSDLETKTFSMPKPNELQCHKLRPKLTLEGPLCTVNFMRFRWTVVEYLYRV